MQNEQTPQTIRLTKSERRIAAQVLGDCITEKHARLYLKFRIPDRHETTPEMTDLTIPEAQALLDQLRTAPAQLAAELYVKISEALERLSRDEVVRQALVTKAARQRLDNTLIPTRPRT